VDEIEDPVPARIHARDQVRPSHWALRRNAGRQAPERSLRGQPGKVRHLALGHEPREQIRVKPVYTEDDQLSGANRSSPSALAGEKQAQTHGAHSQQAQQTKTFSDGRGHYKYDLQVRSSNMVRLHGGGVEPYWLTLGRDHDITTRLEIPGSRYIDCTLHLLS
jgi:hypothetical protein